MEFRTWLESYADDLFGIDPKPEDRNPADHDDDDLPIRRFGVGRLLERLLQKSVSSLRAKSPFNDTVRWGLAAGAAQVKVSPNGNALIQRLIQDLEGNEVWVTQKVFKLNTEKFAGYEEALADSIFDEVKKVYSDKLDSASKDFQGFPGLVKRCAQRMQTANPLFMFHGIKWKEDDHALVSFVIRGSGAGKIVKQVKGGPTPEAVIEFKHDKKRGIIHAILTTYSIEGEGQGWSVDIPYFNGVFMPSQKQDDIIDCFATLLKYF